MQRGPQVWETDAWRATATAWINEALEGHGRASGPQGPPEEWERAPFATLASLLDDSPYGGA